MEKVLRAIDGDKAAFISLIDEEQDKLYRMIFAYVKTESDAVEVYQQVVMLAFEGISQLKKPHYFSTWLIRIAINQSITYLKKRDREKLVTLETFDLLKSDGSEVEEQMDLWRALETLPNNYKTVLLLRFYQDYTIPQIAEITEKPIGTVKTHIRRGLERLREHMKGVYEDEWSQSIEGDDE